jgi:branched-chain amino acid transport system permease protein
MLENLLAQGLSGLASASSLFLVASGLTVIFGVTRIVNFAHGSLYMIGAYLAWTLVTQLPRGHLGFWGGVVGGRADRGRGGCCDRGCCCCAASTARRSCSSCSPHSAWC